MIGWFLVFVGGLFLGFLAPFMMQSYRRWQIVLVSFVVGGLWGLFVSKVIPL